MACLTLAASLTSWGRRGSLVHTTASPRFPQIARVGPRKDSGVHLPSLASRSVTGSCGEALVNAG